MGVQWRANPTARSLRKATLGSPDPNSHSKEQTLPGGWDSVKHPSISETHLPAEGKIYLWKESPFSLAGRSYLPDYSKQSKILAAPDSWHFEVHLDQSRQAKCSDPPCFCTTCQLRMICIFLRGRKKSKDEQYILTHKNYKKFKFQCS